MSGANDPNIVKSFYTFDLPTALALTDPVYKTCGGTLTCLLPYTTDSRVHEKTLAPYVQVNGKFDLFSRPGHLIAGVRYERTDVSATALVPTPVGGQQNSQNEFNVLFSGQGFTNFKGSYQNWLPSVDFDIEPLRGVKLRASYSHTITRADYGSLQGGRRIDTAVPHRRRHRIGRQSRPHPVQVEEHRSVGGMVLRQRELPVGRLSSTRTCRTTSARRRSIRRSPASLRRRPSSTASHRTGRATRRRSTRSGPTPPSPRSSNITRRTSRPMSGRKASFSPARVIRWSTSSSRRRTTATRRRRSTVSSSRIQHNFWNTGFGTILNYTIVNEQPELQQCAARQRPAGSVRGRRPVEQRQRGSVLRQARHPGACRVQLARRFPVGCGDQPDLYRCLRPGRRQRELRADQECRGHSSKASTCNGENRIVHLRSDRNIAQVQKQDARYSARRPLRLLTSR